MHSLAITHPRMQQCSVERCSCCAAGQMAVMSVWAFLCTTFSNSIRLQPPIPISCAESDTPYESSLSYFVMACAKYWNVHPSQSRSVPTVRSKSSRASNGSKRSVQQQVINKKAPPDRNTRTISRRYHSRIHHGRRPVEPTSNLQVLIEASSMCQSMIVD